MTKDTVFGWRYSSGTDGCGQTIHICFFSSLSLNSDLYVDDVICRREGDVVTMKERHQSEGNIVQIFDATVIHDTRDESIGFEVFIRSKVENVAVELIDVLGSEKLWNAALHEECTDIEFRVGDETFFAHRWLVAARSPAMANLLSDLFLEEAANCNVTSLSESDDTSTAAIRTTVIEIKDVAPDVFLEVLQYMYTGKLKVAASKALLIAAEKYEINTLTELCKAALRNIDYEKLSIKLLCY